jgi:hypothetical protein
MDEYEFWAGKDEEEVKAAFLKEICDDEDPDWEDFFELSSEQIDTFTIQDEEVVGSPVTSFRARLDRMISEGQRFPCPFACTEC